MKDNHEVFITDPEIKVPEMGIQQMEIPISMINKNSDPSEKIKLFQSLFKGRDDVYGFKNPPGNPPGFY
jgi:hypothetical protein